MATTQVVIGSKLPLGLVIKHPLNPEHKATIRGLNSSKIIGSTFVTTEIDQDLWEAWKAIHHIKDRPFRPIASGAIFEAKNEASAKSIAVEYSKRRTGLEPMKADGKDSRASGVKPADKKTD